MESQPHRVNPNQLFLNFESAYEFYKAPASAPPPPSPLNYEPNKYSDEDVELVSRIITSNDNYQILGLNASSSFDEIRNAYITLAVKVHPDYNKAPGADEAIKKVNDAFESISLSASRIQNNVMENGHNRMLSDEVLWGVGIVAGLLIFLLIFYFSQRGYSYNVEVSGDYNMPMKTKECGIEFYVKSVDGFDTKYPVGSQARASIEKNIANDYVDYVKNNDICYREHQMQLLYSNIPTPNCDKLQCLDIDIHKG